MPANPRRRLPGLRLAVATALIFTAAACGSDDEAPEPSATTTAADSQAAVTAAAPAPATPDAPVANPADPAQAQPGTPAATQQAPAQQPAEAAQQPAPEQPAGEQPAQQPGEQPGQPPAQQAPAGAGCLSAEQARSLAEAAMAEPVTNASNVTCEGNWAGAFVFTGPGGQVQGPALFTTGGGTTWAYVSPEQCQPSLPGSVYQTFCQSG